MVLTAARDAGVERFAQIARREAPKVGLSEDSCLSYLRDNLTFHLGQRQRHGLERFHELACRLGLVPRTKKGTKKGTFYFFQKRGATRREGTEK